MFAEIKPDETLGLAQLDQLASCLSAVDDEPDGVGGDRVAVEPGGIPEEFTPPIGINLSIQAGLGNPVEQYCSGATDTFATGGMAPFVA